MDSTTPTPPPAPAPEKKPLIETVIISTPVLLTVIATFILGRSSSEMTQAQYQRAVAGQKQSKVADEWAFFQAKRIRGTTYEVTAVSLLAQKADPFTADALIESADALIREIQLTAKEAESLRDALQSLEKKAEAERVQIQSTLNPPDGKSDDRTKLKAALEALVSYPTVVLEKKAEDESVDAEQRKLLEEILDDIRAFKPENEVGAKALRLKKETIENALIRAKLDAAAVNAQGKRIDRVLEKFDGLVDRQTALAREYQRIVGARLSALARAGTDAEEIRKLERRHDRVRDVAARLLGGYKAARYAFDARRYEDDARSNQRTAFLYEVFVFQSAARSDKHLGRSFGFMIAMLVAQVGVTVGSMALALKRRVPVWAVAAIAGVCAIIFGVLVFLEMAPL